MTPDLDRIKQALKLFEGEPIDLLTDLIHLIGEEEFEDRLDTARNHFHAEQEDL